MKNCRKYILRSIGVFALMLLFSCGDDLESLEQITLHSSTPPSTYTNFEIIYSDSGLVKAIINGGVLEQYIRSDTNENYEIMRDSVHLRFYDEQLIVQSELFADYAKREARTNQMEATGNVVLINRKGEKMETEHLIWDEKKGQIISDTNVRITKVGGQVIQGTGLVSDQNFEKYKITKVKGEIPVDFGRETRPEDE